VFECFGFPLILLVVLGVLMLVGHGLWLLLAAILRIIFGSSSDRRSVEPTLGPAAGWSTCPQCERHLLPRHLRCWGCGLDLTSVLAGELADLRTTARQLRYFRAQGALDEATWQQLRAHIAAQREELLTHKPAARVPEPARVPVEGVTLAPPPWQELEETLAGCQEVRNLPPDKRLWAIAQSRQLSEAQLAAMSANAQRNLARLLVRGGFIVEALAAYRRLLRAHPQEPDLVDLALEAARLAVPRDTEQAKWFLEEALAAHPRAEARQEVEELLGRLRRPLAEEVLDVVPMDRTAGQVAPAPDALPTPTRPPPAVSMARPLEPEPELPPPEPRRSWTEMLRGFMEERNILLGELVGGLLMVGCSIALVIYLWRIYSDFPYFPLLIFTGITAALFGAGLYALHRLKLAFTGRSLLVIGTLLVPLNFLVMAGLSKTEPAGPLQIGIDLVCMASFAALLLLAARAFAAEAPGLLMIAVLGSSASQLLVSRFLIPEPQAWRFLLLAALPVACFSASHILLCRLSRHESVPAAQVQGLFFFLGTAAFALAVCLGFLVYQTGDMVRALQRAAVLVAVAGLPVLGGGLVVHRGLAHDPDQGPFRTAGTSLALLGMLVLVLALALAWPDPLAVLLVGALDFAVLTAVAFRFGMPVVHAAALPCLAVGYLAAFHLLDAREGLLATVFSSQGGTALVLLVVALGAAAEWVAHWGQRDHAGVYAGGAGILALASLALVTANGVEEPARAAVVYGVYGTGFLALNARWRRTAAVYLGLALLLAASLWALWWKEADFTPGWATVLAGEALAFAGVARALSTLGGRRQEWRELAALYHQPLRELAGVTGVLALVLALSIPGFPTAAAHTATTGLLAATAFVLAADYRAMPLTWLGSALLLGCLCHALLYRFTGLRPQQPWSAALVLHGSLVLTASFVLRALAAQGQQLTDRSTGEPSAAPEAGPGSSARQEVRSLFAEPLGQSGLVSFIIALPLLTVPLLSVAATKQIEVLAGSYTTWLAVVWLIVSCTERWPRLFAAFQPILTLSTAMAVVGFEGAVLTRLLDPGIVWVASHLILLFLVSLVLVGHVVRERSPEFAFAAGLVANGSLMGGYALAIVTASGSLEAAEWVRLLQLGTLGAAAWAIAWQFSRLWVGAWHEMSENSFARSLMTVQLGMAGVGNAVLLLGGIVPLVCWPDPPLVWLGSAYYSQPVPWTTEAGSFLGWLALGLTLAAFEVRNLDRVEMVQPVPIGWLGLLVIALLACTVDRLAPGWGYRWLMVGTAGYALAWALLAGGLAGRAAGIEPATEPSSGDSRFPLAGLSDAAATFVRTAGLAAVILALKAAFMHDDLLWAAAAIAVACPAGALMAVERRREEWAFMAGLGINLAASFVVWHFDRLRTGSDEFAFLCHMGQANVIATAAGTLLWLAFRRRIYQQRELSVRTGPLLAVQVALGLLSNLAMLGLAFLGLFVDPTIAGKLAEVGGPWGWLALILTLSAALWYADQVIPRNRAHVLVLGGLLLGVLAACTAGNWDTGPTPSPLKWLSFHVLTVLWCMTGLFTLAAGWIGTAFRLTGPEAASEQQRAVFARVADWFPADLIPRWLVAISVLIVLLALRGIGDPQAPAWSAGATLIVATLIGGLALWSGRGRYVHASGFLINLVGILIWLVRPEATFANFVLINVLCLAIASAFWCAVELALRHSNLRIDLRGRGIPFPHLAAQLAVGLLVLLLALGTVAHLVGDKLEVADSLAWATIVFTAAAVSVNLWDPSARFPLPGLYLLGLVPIALALQRPEMALRWTLWNAAMLLSGYVLLVSVIARAVPRLGNVWKALRLPSEAGARAAIWLPAAQVGVAAVAAALTVWMSLGFETTAQRLAGPLAVLLLLLAGVLLTGFLKALNASREGSGTISTGMGLRSATLALGVLLAVETGWALLDPAGPAPWLHRSVLLMVSVAAMTVVYGIGLVRLLPSDSDWAKSSRRMGPVLGGLAMAVLVVVLVQELVSFNRHAVPLPRTEMALPAVLIVVVALIGLTVAGISFAVVPGRDPLGLSERGRMLYVYSCELLLVFLFVHLKLTMPQLLSGWGAKYWTFLVLGIAFLGVGLSEFFARRGVRVLAEPLQRTGLFLPLLPLLAFWRNHLIPGSLYHSLIEQAPGMQPLLVYIDPTSAQTTFGQYAFLWFLTAGLLTFSALSRRSFRYSLLAALAANFGWWSLLYHYRDLGLTFTVHPQLWLIPLALIALVAEHLNRDRLTPRQRTTLRYLALLVIYVSSTADMFIAGLGQSVFLPLVLAVMAVTGVLAGILLRVRAFLFLGVSFLFVVVFAMIWHAAVGRQQTWIWWVSGIVLGGAIIALFALFEKRRNEVLKLVEELKHWS
jgi:hypothetical protein